MAKGSNPNWIEDAHLDRGALGAKASRAGMSTGSFARKNAGKSGKLGKQSRLAETLGKLRNKGATR